MNLTATRTSVRLALLALVALLAVGCGHDRGLTARGSVTVEGSSVGNQAFTFPEDIRLDTAETGPDGRFSGSCEMRRVATEPGADDYGVVIELLRDGGADGLSRVTIMHRTDSAPTDARLEAQVRADVFANEAGSCDITLDYAVADGGMVGVTGTCEIKDADGNSATASVELDLNGCGVAE